MNEREGAGVNDNVERMIADYLRNHPDFFNRHVDVLEAIRVPHPCRPAISLIERQLILLRQQNVQLRKKLRDLVKVARDNDCLSNRMQHLNLILIESGSLDEMLVGIQSVLRDEFNADFTSLRLAAMDVAGTGTGTGALTGKADLGAVAQALFAPVFESGRPVCGRLTNEQNLYLFEDAAEHVESTALVPLKGFDWNGLMAIGSRDHKRFHPGMGTLFLSRIGELISHALQPHMCQPASVAS